MRIVTKDDFIDIYSKLSQRGLFFILSKLNPNGIARTKSAFDKVEIQSANWWIVPAVRQRWNERITGDKDKTYEVYTMETFLSNRKQLRMLSIGSGVCSHELAFAAYPQFEQIICVDIAENLLGQAEKNARGRNLTNIEFWVQNVYTLDLEKESFDVIMFHSSLHHFSNIKGLISDKIDQWLKPDGMLLINEYVGADRFQYPSKQIVWINKGLDLIPTRLKRRLKTEWVKRKYYGSGYVRMIIADPSECIESSRIRPILHEVFDVIVEKPYGGNLLVSVLKDIAHHYLDMNDVEAQLTLDRLFQLEDEYLIDSESDFLFGLYRKRK